MDFSNIKIEKSKYKRREYFDERNDIEKSACCKVNFSTIEITSKKYVETTSIFDHRNYIEKVPGNDVEIRRSLVFHVST